MYIPANCSTLETVPKQQIRLGIQGYPGSGKTYGAMTFLNPVVMDLDRGLGAHIGRKDIIQCPFYDLEFCKKVNPNHKGINTLRDTLLLWIDKEGIKLDSDQTLVVDGGTPLQNIYHKWYENNRVFSKSTGKEVEYAEWTLKIDFFDDFCRRLKELKCDVIFITHESEKKEKSGEYVGKIRPLISGQSGDKLSSHFTDWFRQWSIKKPDVDKMDDKALSKWGMKKDEFKSMLSTFPRDTLYFWQLTGDDIFDAKASSLVNFPDFIPSNFESFKKYMRK